jgi:hypothetical protein
MHGKKEEIHKEFGFGSFRKRNHLQDLCIDG